MSVKPIIKSSSKNPVYTIKRVNPGVSTSDSKVVLKPDFPARRNTFVPYVSVTPGGYHTA